MAIYTVGRRRVIVALLLSAALLLTLDLRGNPIVDRMRDGFAIAMSPVERATDVVTRPIERAASSYANYDDLQRENEALREQVDRQRGAQAAAEASIIDYQLLLALNNLPSLTGISTVKSQVVGVATNNIDQIVEINKGSLDGIDVGMPVVNQAGLIGKITQVNATTSKVMLITDPRYSIPVEILGGAGALSDPDADNTVDTTPSGRTQAENDALIEGASTPTTDPVDTTPLDVFADDVPLPDAEVLDIGATSLPVDSVPADSLPADSLPADSIPFDPTVTVETNSDGTPVDISTTTTTLPLQADQLEKEFGVLQGRGQGRLPQIRFLQDVPSLAVLQVGDLIETSGGSESLAPPNIPVGRVINRADRPGVGGPLLEIELYADLDNLNFVRVVLYQPLTEVGG